MKVRRVLRWGLEKVCVTEYIGQKECPMMMRWEFLKIGPRKEPWLKAMIHYFPPNTTDRDPHDHPRSFITCILSGGYFNREWENFHGIELQTMEWLGRGSVRLRPARHMHITETQEQGAWTLVMMGPMVRKWGFWRDSTWWPWKRYVEQFGGVVRCDTGELDESQPGEYAPYTVKAEVPVEDTTVPLEWLDEGEEDPNGPRA